MEICFYGAGLPIHLIKGFVGTIKKTSVGLLVFTGNSTLMEAEENVFQEL